MAAPVRHGARPLGPGAVRELAVREQGGRERGRASAADPSAAGPAVDERGRIVTDAALRSVSHPEGYAIGDAAAIRRGRMFLAPTACPLPGTASTNPRPPSGFL
ncbi:hypothetical protein GCM10010421_46820 [Streptomyces glaucus]|uniref:FAD/NAD(P)-binding domain-containing protein n=1 Tax=Streptomyces glaucus TaxID=284029 RepID=A0ABN3K4E3_9ACTN